jgi:hypothetical protein
MAIGLALLGQGWALGKIQLFEFKKANKFKKLNNKAW